MTRFDLGQYREKAARGIADSVQREALANLQNRFGRGTARAYQLLPEGPALRRHAHELRKTAIDHLDGLLQVLAARIRARGGHVHFAATADDACAVAVRVARQHGVRLAVKGKSMVTEEIGLNAAMTRAGIEVVETDLGEYIVQLAGETPSHIIAPAIHRTRRQIGRLFAEKLGIPYTEDPPTLTRAARKALREKFLAADMGISGCNLACAETGHITTLSNEGNIRMAATLPRVQVVFMGMERITARLEDHDSLFRLLSRGAAVQDIATYVSYVGGPRQPGEVDGPDTFHLVVLDNGRSKLLAEPEFREMLYCIRCAACLNVCPVYGRIGGHAYGNPYTGPVGAVVAPLLFGIENGRDLCTGETLCGACRNACPVDIDIPRMLLLLRAKLAEGDPAWRVRPASKLERAIYRCWALLVTRPKLYTLALAVAGRAQRLLPSRGGMLHRLPRPLSGWTRHRDLRPLAGTPFRRLWRGQAVNLDDA